MNVKWHSPRCISVMMLYNKCPAGLLYASILAYCTCKKILTVCEPGRTTWPRASSVRSEWTTAPYLGAQRLSFACAVLVRKSFLWASSKKEDAWIDWTSFYPAPFFAWRFLHVLKIYSCVLKPVCFGATFTRALP